MQDHLMVASQVGLWIMAALQMAVVFGLVRQIGLLHRRIAPTGARMSSVGLKIGDRAPELNVSDLDGESVSLGSARGRMTLLAFVSPSCPVCSELMPAIQSIYRSERDYLDVVLAGISGSGDENNEYRMSHSVEHIPYVASLDLAQRYDVGAPPYAILIGVDGTVKSKGLVNHFEQLESLLTAARMGHASLESFMKEKTKNPGGQPIAQTSTNSSVSEPA